ncbi:hypothetical protein TMatcc_007849 [Talaromyces marneffei ATCC 18224]|uniref:RRM domain-containing protein n=1 Tax=Talaromyces marneffei (strain ATCC 18224 / CBS 334.59 / QM 7333) TaxID=441960 RepID=B6QDC2_TALMQ|nr:uncharacterized protein EYB26_004768 [Talaromyces marneffei]EEA24750.1 hypothetical protein PMAA_087280 [Talaromyces marneffei ATCC 18224]KAE8552766.1 hypothetical protein EYB25_004145 [Talaromyces marneffei]QGA17098.1 hypothetical protein EYB26_004768 [Talaromyces marneffei]
MVAKKAAGKKASAPSFDSIIEAERLNRKKQENQALADQLLGSKKRRASAPGPGVGSKKTPADRSLASRIGVVKRSASTSSKPKANTIATARATAKQTTPAKATSRRTREDRMIEDINGKKDVNLAPRKQTEITIKGTAATGPFVVVGRNFAPGTNAADIETAMEPVAGHIVGVHITSYTPYVNAQIACAEKWGAEAIVAQFNGKKADGRILSIEYRGGGSHFFGPTSGKRTAPNSYDTLREQADRERRERKKVVEPQSQDGRNEFSDSKGRPRRADGRTNDNMELYSDKMMVDAPSAPISKRGRGFR